MTRTRPTAGWVGALLVMALLAFGVFQACGDPSGDRPAALPLTLAVSPITYSGLIAVADEMGYFTEAVLDVTVTLHPSGREAMEAVCRGGQVATAADIAFSAMVPDEPPLRVLATIGTFVGSQVVARRDRNIRDPADLRGKRIGFSAGTVSDDFRYAFWFSKTCPWTRSRR